MLRRRCNGLYTAGVSVWILAFLALFSITFGQDEIVAKWNKMADSGTAALAGRASHRAVVYDRKLFLFGGINSQKEILSDVNSLDIDTNKWEELTSSERFYKRVGFSATSLAGRPLTLVYGGAMASSSPSSISQSLDIFDHISDSWVNPPTTCTSCQAGPLSHHGAVAIGNQTLFLFGGSDGHKEQHAIWKYELDSGSWEKITSSNGPPARAEATVFSCNDTDIFVFGGKSGSTILNDMWKFNIGSRTWLKMPTKTETSAEEVVGLAGASGFCIDQSPYLVLFGGRNANDGVSNEFLIYDLVYQRFDRTLLVRQAKTSPSGRTRHTLSVTEVEQDSFGSTNVKAILIGGETASKDIVEDPAYELTLQLSRPTHFPTKEITCGAKLSEQAPIQVTVKPLKNLISGPTARSGATMATRNGKLLYLGGTYNRFLVDDIFGELYAVPTAELAETSRTRWKLHKALRNSPPARSGHTSTIFEDSSSMVVFGGTTRTSWSTSASNELYQLFTDGLQWKKLEPAAGSDVPPGRSNHGAVALGSHLVIFGGKTDKSVILKDIWAFDFPASSWRHITPSGAFPMPRYGHSMVLDEETSEILVFGGQGENNAVFNSMYILKNALSEDPSWERIRPKNDQLPPERHSHASFLIRHKSPSAPGDARFLVIVGGQDGQRNHLSDIWAFDIDKKQWCDLSNYVGNKLPPISAAAYTQLPTGDLIIGTGFGAPDEFFTIQLRSNQNIKAAEPVIASVPVVEPTIPAKTPESVREVVAPSPQAPEPTIVQEPQKPSVVVQTVPKFTTPFDSALDYFLAHKDSPTGRELAKIIEPTKTKEQEARNFLALADASIPDLETQLQPGTASVDEQAFGLAIETVMSSMVTFQKLHESLIRSQSPQGSRERARKSVIQQLSHVKASRSVLFHHTQTTSHLLSSFVDIQREFNQTGSKLLNIYSQDIWNQQKQDEAKHFEIARLSRKRLERMEKMDSITKEMKDKEREEVSLNTDYKTTEEELIRVPTDLSNQQEEILSLEDRIAGYSEESKRAADENSRYIRERDDTKDEIQKIREQEQHLKTIFETAASMRSVAEYQAKYAEIHTTGFKKLKEAFSGLREAVPRTDASEADEAGLIAPEADAPLDDLELIASLESDETGILPHVASREPTYEILERRAAQKKKTLEAAFASAMTRMNQIYRMIRESDEKVKQLQKKLTKADEELLEKMRRRQELTDRQNSLLSQRGKQLAELSKIRDSLAKLQSEKNRLMAEDAQDIAAIAAIQDEMQKGKQSNDQKRKHFVDLVDKWKMLNQSMQNTANQLQSKDLDAAHNSLRAQFSSVREEVVKFRADQDAHVRTAITRDKLPELAAVISTCRDAIERIMREPPKNQALALVKSEGDEDDLSQTIM